MRNDYYTKVTLEISKMCRDGNEWQMENDVLAHNLADVYEMMVIDFFTSVAFLETHF